MEIRMYSHEDYKTICKWWDDWGWPCIPEDSLPQTGLIVSRDGVDLYAAFLYRTDSNICWLDWFVGNKQTTKKQREGALESLIAAGRETAKAMGFANVFCSVRNRSLISKLEKCGFSGKDEQMTNFLGVV